MSERGVRRKRERSMRRKRIDTEQRRNGERGQAFTEYTMMLGLLLVWLQGRDPR